MKFSISNLINRYLIRNARGHKVFKPAQCIFADSSEVLNGDPNLLQLMSLWDELPVLKPKQRYSNLHCMVTDTLLRAVSGDPRLLSDLYFTFIEELT